MRMIRWLGMVLVAVLLAAWPVLSPLAGGTAWAAEKAGQAQAGGNRAGGNEEDITDITADNMEIDDEKNLIVFTGNVRAVQGDTTLYADRLVVHTEKVKNDKGEEETKMRRWIATGNLRIVKPDTEITGKKADMDVQKDIVTVIGDVVVKQPTSTIRGAKLISNLKTNVTRIVATGKKRVHGVFR